MSWGSTQPLAEMSSRNLLGGKGRPACEADVTAICESIVEKIWEPRRLKTLWASTVCYRDSFIIYLYRRHMKETAIGARGALVFLPYLLQSEDNNSVPNNNFVSKGRPLYEKVRAVSLNIFYISSPRVLRLVHLLTILASRSQTARSKIFCSEI
jgi:hypothetical protein